jgi:hypothetical protein
MGIGAGIRGLAAVPARDLIHKGDDTMSQVRSRYSHHLDEPHAVLTGRKLVDISWRWRTSIWVERPAHYAFEKEWHRHAENVPACCSRLAPIRCQSKRLGELLLGHAHLNAPHAQMVADVVRFGMFIHQSFRQHLYPRPGAGIDGHLIIFRIVDANVLASGRVHATRPAVRPMHLCIFQISYNCVPDEKASVLFALKQAIQLSRLFAGKRIGTHTYHRFNREGWTLAGCAQRHWRCADI